MKARARTIRRKRQAGFTLIELMVAGVVLVVGLLGVMGLFSTAVGNNGRSRVDSTATMVSQAVIEQITAVLARGGPPAVIDGEGTTHTISTSEGGAALSGDSIDFNEASPPAGYSMMYVVASDPGANNKATYDVRWNVTALGNTGAQPTYLVTVGARPKNMHPGRFTFALPVTLRAYVGAQ